MNSRSRSWRTPKRRTSSGAFNPSDADTVTAYIGARDPSAEDFPLLETGPNTLSFNGNTSWADSTVTLVDFHGLTAEVDTLHAQWSFLAPDGSSESYDVQMTETGAETRHFVYNLGIENVYDVSYGRSSTDSGTFLPFIVRIKGPAGVLTGDTVNTFDRDWALKRLNYGDGEYEYVIDDQEKPVVFLPAAYAQTHIQCKPLGAMVQCNLKTGEEYAIGAKQLKIVSGLVVMWGDVYSEVLAAIPEGDVKRYAYALYVPQGGPVPTYVYMPADEHMDHNDESLRTEIIWRYVGTEDTVLIFDSPFQFETDIYYREQVVEAIQTQQIGWALRPDFNPAYWLTSTEVRHDDAYAAIENMWSIDEDRYEYKMACLLAAAYVHYRGASMAVGKTEFNRVVGQTLIVVGADGKPRLKPTLYTWQVIEDAAWYPGDWGYIKNEQPNPPQGLEGENIFYLGGCFEEDYGIFKDSPDTFWGHPAGRKSLQQWLTVVEGWDGDENNSSAKLDSYRRGLRQPLP